jgi:hypothetical protein
MEGGRKIGELMNYTKKSKKKRSVEGRMKGSLAMESRGSRGEDFHRNVISPYLDVLLADREKSGSILPLGGPTSLDAEQSNPGF